MAEEVILDFLRARAPKRIALMGHVRPDGDALGSCVGLARALRGAGYEARVMNPGTLPSSLAFLDDGETLVTGGDGWWRDYDCVGVLDCGEASRVAEENREALTALPVFNIDHHASSVGLGEAVWCEAGASSVGEMAVRLCRRAGWRMDAAAAQALWTAIVTDTGRFCFENATAAALEAARFCVEAGAEPHAAAVHLYQSVTPADRRLEGVVLSRMTLHENGRLAEAWLGQEDFAGAGVGVEGAQDKINILRDTAGVEVAVFMYETNDGGVKASLRTASPYNALDVVKAFGGGGHERAAGCTVEGLGLPAAREAVVGLARRVFFHSIHDKK